MYSEKGDYYGKKYNAKYPVQTVEKAIDILIYLKENPSPRGLSLNDLSKGLKMGKSSIHRFLDMLLEYNFVEKSEDGTSYFLSWGLFELGNVVPHYRNISSNKIDEYLEKLSNDFGEVINLGVMNVYSMVIVKSVFPLHKNVKNKLITSMQVGEREPFFCTGIGKLFLSEMSENEAVEIFSNVPDKSITPYTIKTKEELLKELNIIRNRGYSLDNKASDLDIICIAVALRDYSQKIVAGISMSLPSNRFDYKKVDEIVASMKENAEEISKFLGNS